MQGLQKAINQSLKDFANLAYQRELSKKLDKLYTRFVEWKEGSFPIEKLNEEIDKYSNKKLKKLNGFYEGFTSQTVVAKAISKGILSKEEIPEDVYEVIESVVAFFDDNPEALN